MSKPLRITILGAGAIGGYIGSHLKLVGNEVVFIDRPERVAYLEHNPIEVVENNQTTQIQIPAYGPGSPALTGQSWDLMILGVKAYDAESAFSSILETFHPLPPVLCLQNGVEVEALLRGKYRVEHVIASSVTTALGREGQGRIIVEKARGLALSGKHPLVPRLAEDLLKSGIHTEIAGDEKSMKWSKLLTNLVGNAAAAILDLSPGEIYNQPGLLRLEIGQLKEAIAVMSALGARVQNLPGIPVKALAWTTRLPYQITRVLLPRAISGGRGAKMPSMHIDLHNRNQRSEVDWLNGAVVRFGLEMEVATPVNRFFSQTLSDLVTGKVEFDTYRKQPSRLLAAFEESS